MNTKLIGISLVVIVLVVAAALVLKTKDTSKTNTATTNQTPTITTQQAIEKKPNTTSVVVTTNGYEPKNITIKQGDKVSWTNQSGTEVTVNSDVHPTHLLWPFLNLGNFKQGEIVSVIFEKAGTYTYHNHFNSSQVGSVKVE
ncbi:MAG: plastocyanin/azurin family copper-binding protein [Patescibacteria group bacterium]